MPTTPAQAFEHEEVGSSSPHGEMVLDTYGLNLARVVRQRMPTMRWRTSRPLRQRNM